jgi:hypothetical protein
MVLNVVVVLGLLAWSQAALQSSTTPGSGSGSKAASTTKGTTGSKATTTKGTTGSKATTTTKTTTVTKTTVTIKKGSTVKKGAGQTGKWLLTYRDRATAAAKELTFSTEDAANRWFQAYKQKHPLALGSITQISTSGSRLKK